MAGETKLVLPLILLVVNCMQHFVYGEPQVPCFNIFGDSLSDNGNNNNLITSAKANYLPYGIDFEMGPKGRFTNNLTVNDIIGQLLGFDQFIPPFASLDGFVNLRGVNYASGGAGILEESGANLGDRSSFRSQIENHGITVSKIPTTKFEDIEKAKESLNKCLYSINIGSNDYINNYFLDWSPTSRMYSLEQFTAILIEQYFQLVQELYNWGARKFMLFGLGRIGCTPNAISTRGTNGSCVEKMNTAASLFNDKLKALVDQMNSNNSAGSKTIFVNMSFTGLYEGFRVSNASCCPTMPDGRCVPDGKPCPDRNDRVFWDGIHPTYAVNKQIAMILYNDSNPNITYPMNVKGLVE